MTAKTNGFLFKLGLALAPAVFASPAPREAALVAASSSLALAVLHGLTFPLRKWALPFWKDFFILALIASLATGADLAARHFCYHIWKGTGVFFSVIVVNTLLVLRSESGRIKLKTGIWFAPLAVALAALKAGCGEAAKSPAAVFFAVALALFGIGALVRSKRWAL